MASVSFDTTKNGFRVSFREGVSTGRRKRSIWLGNVPESLAQEVARHVQHLALVQDIGEPPSKATALWLAQLSAKIHDKLASAGLVESRDKVAASLITLQEWCDQYIEERTDVKPSTVETYEKARDSLVAYFGAGKQIKDIRPEDAVKWRRWMLSKGNRRDKDRTTMAEATVRRRSGKAKTFFSEAVERGLIPSDPFKKLPANVAANQKRQFFVPADWIELCIEKAPDSQWKTILALARFGGLRCPSELVRLRWLDVNLSERRMVIHASKTEHHETGGVRVCPIFPELLPYLQAARDAADETSEFVVRLSNGTASNLRTRFVSIVKAAGLVPWPKLFQNLRASRETELMTKFPAKDVSAWLGNSVPVAMAHYAMATADSFKEATEVTASKSGSTCGSISRVADAILKNSQDATGTENDARMSRVMVRDGRGMATAMGDTELESVTSAV